MLPFVEEALGDDDLVFVLVGEGFHLGDEHIPVDVDGLGLLCEDQGNTEFPGHEGGDADAGGFDGQHLGDGAVAEAALEFTADLLHQGDVHLMVQEAVHLQHIAGLDDAVFQDSLF